MEEGLDRVEGVGLVQVVGLAEKIADVQAVRLGHFGESVGEKGRHHRFAATSISRYPQQGGLGGMEPFLELGMLENPLAGPFDRYGVSRSMCNVVGCVERLDQCLGLSRRWLQLEVFVEAFVVAFQ
jgi:hypothetical protein